ncbi:NADP-dependent oxidoreductase domain-containing protein [Panaeolus papilionaceus]|nr:NADP-dependent oxidoreductase domain-containing protein [Panaeolus papilionaceus]
MTECDISQKLTLNSSVTLSTGYKMPLLGFGVYQNYTTKDSCLQAFKAGYSNNRHIDSAQVYKNEAHVGQAVHESGIDRGELFITTKCVSKTHGYESTLRGIDDSLTRMGFDYVDLFLIHDPFSGKEKRLDSYRALLEGQSKGKIRTVGVSNYGVKHLEEIRDAGYPAPAVNQIELHPFCQQKDIVDYCRKNQIVIQAYCPILRGQMDHEAITRVAQKHNREPAQVLIRWSLQRGFVPLPKSATPSRILSNTKLYDFQLGSEDMETLNSLDVGKDGAISWNPVNAP